MQRSWFSRATVDIIICEHVTAAAASMNSSNLHTLILLHALLFKSGTATIDRCSVDDRIMDRGGQCLLVLGDSNRGNVIEHTIHNIMCCEMFVPISYSAKGRRYSPVVCQFNPTVRGGLSMAGGKCCPFFLLVCVLTVVSTTSLDLSFYYLDRPSLK